MINMFVGGGIGLALSGACYIYVQWYERRAKK